jgi:hypothetical protein
VRRSISRSIGDLLNREPAGRSAGGRPGAVMRQETVHRYAAEAGFARVETLAIDNEFWRFYRLLP